MGCTDLVVKYVLFVVNFFVSIIGIVFIVGGAFLVYYLRHLADVVSIVDINGAIVLIIMGCIIFLTAFLGCTGAIIEIPLMLNIFGAFMLILSFLMTGTVLKIGRLANTWEENWFEYIIDDRELMNVFHVIEAMVQCCGISGMETYEALSMPLPPTCCENFDIPGLDNFDIINIEQIVMQINSTDFICAQDDAYDVGCQRFMVHMLHLVRRILVDICVIVISIEIAAAIFAFYLAQHIKNEKESARSPHHRVL